MSFWDHAIFIFTDGLKTETNTVSEVISEDLVISLSLRLPNTWKCYLSKT